MRTFYERIKSRKGHGKAIVATANEMHASVMDEKNDPYGYIWSIATHKVEASPEEMEKVAKEAFSKCNIQSISTMN